MRDFEDGGRRPRHEERCRRYLIANGPEKMRIIEEAIWDRAMKVHWKECMSLLKNGLVGELAAMFVLDPETLAGNATLKDNAGLDAAPGLDIFHDYIPQLPYEIRQIIWKYAAPPQISTAESHLYILPQPFTMDLDELYRTYAGQWPSNRTHNKSIQTRPPGLGYQRFRTGSAKSGFQYPYPYKGEGFSGVMGELLGSRESRFLRRD